MFSPKLIVRYRLQLSHFRKTNSENVSLSHNLRQNNWRETCNMPNMQIRLLQRFIFKNLEIYLLKILTLSVAMSALILVSIFSLNEFGYDRFHKNHKSIFRLTERSNTETYGRNRHSTQISKSVYNELNVQQEAVITRIKVLNELRVITDDHTYHDQQMHVADTQIMDVFSFTIQHGELSEFRENPFSILLSTDAAEEYFGTANVSGKQLSLFTFGDTIKLEVAAVYQAFPSNSHQKFNSFIRFNEVLLKSLGFDPSLSEVYGLQENISAVKLKEVKDKTYDTQQISSIYFDQRMLGEDVVHGDRYSVIILISITALILFLALTSFINMTSLTLPNRVKEVAIKKLAGYNKLQLAMSFTGESLFTTIVSLIIGSGTLWLCWEHIEAIQMIDLPNLAKQESASLILIIAIFCALLSLSPLIMVSKFINASASRLLGSEAITFPRFKNVIIILQLGISLFLIVSALVINRQVVYSLVKEPGRNNFQVLYVNYPKDMTENQFRSLKAVWEKSKPNIVDVIATSQLPNQVSSKDLETNIYSLSVEPGFRDFFDLEILHGNWFGANDRDSILVINESAVKLINKNSKNTIGVFKDLGRDFNQPEKPMMLKRGSYTQHNFLCIRVLEVDILKTVSFLENYFTQNGQKANVRFMNPRFESWLSYQVGLNRLSNLLTIIAAILSCLAIYGLSVSVVRDKLRQIAIRKICGAELFHIVLLLVKEFFVQLFIALLITTPIAYILIKELLRNFAYATTLHWTDPLYPLVYCITVITGLCIVQTFTLNRADLSGVLKE